MVASDAFVEWAHDAGQRPGTSRRRSRNGSPRALDVILEINLRGALQIRKAFVNAV